MSEPAASKVPSRMEPSGRIAEKFRYLSDSSELGLVAFITAGDPSLDASEKIAVAAAAAGADILELGVPFSDPIADGPTIQRSSERALRAGATLSGVIDLVRKIRARSSIPIVLFSYFNPILQMGLERFADAAAAAGADGALCTDLTPEESGEYRAALRSRGLDTIFLAAPTSSEARLAKIAEASSGFLYVVSRTGVTGTRDGFPEELPALIRRTRSVTSLPIAVGFGISLPTQVAVLGGIADAAVVGSALVSEIEKSSSPEGAADAVAGKIRVLKRAAREGVSRRGEVDE